MLRDHFHPPLHPRHAWESFHAAWLGYICESLNDLLPKNYFAQEQVHAGRRIEIDVGTYEQLDGERESNDSDTGGVAIAEPKAKLWKPPAATASIPAVFADDFAALGRLVIVEHGRNAFSLYGHLGSVAVKRGDAVTRGVSLGSVGRTPAGTAALYFELRIDGQPVDPLEWVKPTVHGRARP